MLDEAGLQTTLADLVGKREIKVLLQRRDAVLAGAAAAAAGGAH
jgi:hypothetical protein